jgi:hypothetical protein
MSSSWGLPQPPVRVQPAVLPPAAPPTKAGARKVTRGGYLEARLGDTGDHWVRQFFYLSSGTLTRFADESMSEELEVLPLDYNSTVFETNMRPPTSFQIVARGGSCHLQGLWVVCGCTTPVHAVDSTLGRAVHTASPRSVGKDKDETVAWMTALRAAISNIELDLSDPLCREALRREDEKYQVCFREKRPLGMVLERSGEWALVKVSRTARLVEVEAV